MSDTRDRLAESEQLPTEVGARLLATFGSATKDLLDAMREVARDLGERVGALERRVTALEYVLRHLCWDNRHMLVGGEGWARRNLDTIDKAQDHGGTEAAHLDRREAPTPAGAASVQPAPAPCPDCGKRLCQCKQPAPAPDSSATSYHNWTQAAPAPEASEEAAVRLTFSLYEWHDSIGGKPLEVRSYLRQIAEHIAAVDVPRLEREAGERMVRKFAAHYDDLYNQRLAEGLPAPVAWSEAKRFLKEGA